MEFKKVTWILRITELIKNQKLLTTIRLKKKNKTALKNSMPKIWHYWCNFQQFFWHHGHILPSGVWGVGQLIVITQHLHLQQLRNHVLTCIKSATDINKFSVEREQWKREGYKSLILLPVSTYIYIYIYIE